ncbi:diguanylate cyclase [Litoribrevibacter euphylliae]|uniref:diguanylate cyclase n=1 Tax=Litoribrevibacter euphylliae TaxID=1834034 RepID=A0ABV7H7A6_9GAMM
MVDSPSKKPLSALLIEPSFIVQQVFSSILQKQGFCVESCKTAGDALTLIQQKSFDLVCVAYLLPDSTGIDICRQVRELDQEKRNTPVVLVTSEDNKSILLEVFKAGATEIFKKNDVEGFDSYLTQFVLSVMEYKTLYGKILYVEDSRSTAQLISTLLKLNGMEVDHFTTAEAALEAFDEENYDLIITDIILEGELTGSHLVQKVRQDQSKDTIPILAISGMEDPSRRVSLLKSGVNDFVSKPFLHDELMARVHNLLRSKKLFDRVQEQREALRELAMKDQLTGLYNRHFLMEVGPQRINEAQRHKQPLSMVVVDLDKFKAINDNYGHAIGDIVLKEVGTLLQEQSRTEDVACRFGGEEFVLILTHCDLLSAIEKADAIRERIESLKPAGIDVTASFGVSSLTATDDGISNLFDRADQAVYQSKDEGRNRVTAV